MSSFAVIIAGLSGAGKTTVADALIAAEGNLEMSRSATTRQRRGDGRDDEYVYLSREEFLKSIEHGDMLEHTDYNGNLYGTKRCELSRILDSGKYPILVLDCNGVRALKERLDYPVYAFYVYTSLEEAERRLAYRDSLTPDSEKKHQVFVSRLAENKRDYLKLHEFPELFDFYTENVTVEECVAELLAVLSELRAGREVMSTDEKARITAKFRKEAELKG